MAIGRIERILRHIRFRYPGGYRFVGAVGNGPYQRALSFSCGWRCGVWKCSSQTWRVVFQAETMWVLEDLLLFPDQNRNVIFVRYFCFPSSPDISLDFVSRKIRTRGKTKLTASLGTIRKGYNKTRQPEIRLSRKLKKKDHADYGVNLSRKVCRFFNSFSCLCQCRSFLLMWIITICLFKKKTTIFCSRI